MRQELLLDQSKRKLDDSAEEIGEVLIEEEGLNPREHGEGEALEHLLIPHLVGCPSIDISHRR